MTTTKQERDEFLQEKVTGLDYRTLSDRAKNALSCFNLNTTRALLTATDAKLKEIGLLQLDIRVIDKILKSHGMKRSLVGSTVRLRVMNEDAVVDIGKYAGKTIGSLIAAGRVRAVRWLYYNVEYIDLTNEVKKKIGLTRIIPKPGVDRESGILCDEDNEKNIGGINRIKKISHMAKEMRIDNLNKQKKEASFLSKEKLQAMNHGRMNPNVPREDSKRRYDPRPFSGYITKHGLDRFPQGDNVKIQTASKQFYSEILENVGPLFIRHGREFIANMKFEDYVRKTYPEKADEMLKACLFTDFSTPEYFDLLRSLQMYVPDMVKLLSAREAHYHYLLLTDPATGSHILLKEATLRNLMPPEKGKVINLFNEDSFKEENLEKALLSASKRRYANIEKLFDEMGKDVYALSIEQIERTFVDTILSRGGVFSNYEAQHSRGRQKTGYNLKVKDGALWIMPDRSNLQTRAYMRFSEWAQANIMKIDLLRDRIKHCMIAEGR